MAFVLWSIWSYLGGKWRPENTQDVRRRYLRASGVSGQAFIWALLAGALSVVALAGLWIVIFRVARIPGNTVPDFSKYPVVTVVSTLIMASLVSSVAEEAGFRGYFQAALELRFSAPAAILIQALLIAPAHGMTQGFRWPTVVFYLLVDTMLGTSAYLTRSIIPGVIVHSMGLLTFFSVIWPEDRYRVPIWESGADQGFWIHSAQTVLFGGFAIGAYMRLAKLTHSSRKTAVA
jgi:membrane protease YdiL (CAAX protease family)